MFEDGSETTKTSDWLSFKYVNDYALSIFKDFEI